MTDWPSFTIMLALFVSAAVIVAVAIVAPTPVKALVLAYILAP